jgi:transcriptional regulator with XRE-family HTH domain
MTTFDLRAWQKQMNLTYDSAAAALGVSRATYANYINEHTRIPPAIGLACAALAAGLVAYSAD